MKTFIIINGTKSYIITKESMEEARCFAIDVCNHSEEIIIRELSELIDCTNLNYSHKYFESV